MIIDENYQNIIKNKGKKHAYAKNLDAIGKLTGKAYTKVVAYEDKFESPETVKNSENSDDEIQNLADIPEANDKLETDAGYNSNKSKISKILS